MTAANLTRQQQKDLEQIKSVSWDYSRRRDQRDERIARAYASGIPAATIAAAAGLTRVRIYQIIGRS